MSTVYVATVDTRYEIVAVAETEAEAIQVAATKALEYMRSWDAITPGENDTVEGIIEWFGIGATRVEMGTAVYADNGEHGG